MLESRRVFRVGALVLALYIGAPVVDAQVFIRGDANRDGRVSMRDAQKIINYVERRRDRRRHGRRPPRVPACLKAYDVNDNGKVNLGDARRLLRTLVSHQTPRPPWPDCGEDPTPDNLGCDSFPLCTPPAPDGFTSSGENAEGYDLFTHDQTGAVFVKLPGNETLAPFLIAACETNQAEYAAAMAGSTLSADPSARKGADLPVEMVSWDDLHHAEGFLARTGLSLPSQAQWEYACRAGTTTEFSFGDGCVDVHCAPCVPAADNMWYCDNAGGVTQICGSKPANAFGLHDMHGNVREWCEDGIVSPFGTNRIFRGGSCFTATMFCRSDHRDATLPFITYSTFGFRAVLPLP